MSSDIPLTWSEFKQAVTMLVEALDSMQVQFGICGGAAVALIRDRYNLQIRMTQDIDLIVQPDKSRHINAESVSQRLFKDFPSQFEAVNCFGVSIPAARITRDNGTQILVEVEMFDVEAWPERQQYDLDKVRNSRVQVPVSGEKIAYVLSPLWLLREKIITYHHRLGSAKEESDLRDIGSLFPFVKGKVLVLESEEETQALKALLERKPEWEESLKEAIECLAIFGN